jgi:Dolichyl-phosphate-mannose-protein mannosyltransferase
MGWSWRPRLDGLVERPLPLFAAVFMIFIIGFGASIFLVPHRYGRLIVGDGIYYYVYLRSVVIDGDLDFTNDYTLYQSFNNEDLQKKREMLELHKTPLGKPANYFSVGPAVLWSPVYVPTHLLAVMLGLPQDGYSYWYEAPILLFSIVYGFVGFLLIYRVAVGLFSRWAAFVAVLGMWMATNVVYYMGISPSASHVLSLFAVALFVFLWWRFRGKRTWRGWFILGLSAGLMTLVRWQDILVTLLALFDMIDDGWAIVKNRSFVSMVRAKVPEGLIFTAGLLIAFSPQMAAWQILYGAPITAPQGASFFYPLRPEMWNVLFGLKRGLFTWTPLIFLAALGFLPLYRRDRALGSAAFAIFLAETYVNSIVYDWWGGEAFGARRFIGLIPFFALGLAALVEAIAARVSRRTVLVALGAFTVWNLLFILQYDLWLHGIGHISADPTVAEITVDKFITPFQLLARLK